MRPAKQLIILLTVVLVYVACKKSANPPSTGTTTTTTGDSTTAANNSCQLQDRFDGSYDWVYSYNADKTLNNTTIAQANLFPYIAMYTYNGDTSRIDVNSNGLKSFVYFVKNGQGQVTDLHYVSTGLTSTPLNWTHFSFDYIGQNPSQCTMTVDGFDKVAFFDYVYTNGNLTEVSLDPKSTFDLPIYNMTFTYDESKPAVQCDLFWEKSKFANVTAWYFTGIYNSLYPVQNKNVLSAMTYTDTGKVVRTAAAYTFDDKNNIIGSIATANVYTVYDTIAYHYSCSN